MQDPLIITIAPEQAGMRLDKALAESCEQLSRSYLQQLMHDGHVFLAAAAASNPTSKVRAGQQYRIHLPEITPLALEPVSMQLDIVHEDAHLLVINKQAGLTVHPAASTREPTLVHGLLAHCAGTLSGIGGVARPGIVHRLDKDTSGLMLVAKTDQAHQHLSAQLKDRSLTRRYEALCWGVPTASKGTIDAPIGRHPRDRTRMAVVKRGGREASTHYELLEAFSPFSHIACKLQTGRTHQIRVHLTHLGHSLIGDPVYGQQTDKRFKQYGLQGDEAPQETADGLEAASLPPSKDICRKHVKNFTRQALHAAQIRFIHPHSEQEMQFSSPLPSDMANLLDYLKILAK